MWQMICFTSVAVAYAQEATRATRSNWSSRPLPVRRAFFYKVDDTTVSDQLRGFGKAVEKYGDEWPVVCLIDSRLPIRVVGEAAATAGKAGFKNVRSFALDHSTGKVSEIKFGPGCQYPVNNSGNAAMTRVAADYLHDVGYWSRDPQVPVEVWKNTNGGH